MSGPANRGKVAEKKVVARLGELSRTVNTTFYRLPDAHAGSLQPTLADFIFLRDGDFTLIEVKEVEHDYRLPFKNFDPSQVGRMRAWKWAKAECIVLVYHSKLDLWRGYDIDRFASRTEGKGSWDLRDTEPKPLESLLTSPLTSSKSRST